MLRAALLFSLLHVTCPWCFAAEPPGYYASARGKTGAALRAALHDIIANHRALTYSETREALKVLDEDADNRNNVLLIYSRESKPKSAFVPADDGWNREHLWPQSYGIDGAEPAYSDLFNLRAADESVNSDRGNQYFDLSDPSAPDYQPRGRVAEAPLCSQDIDSWEPPDEVKGDIARSMFYMDVRYEGGASEPDLELVDSVSQINSSAARMGRLSALLVWHELDPVDDTERLRNALIHTNYQRNRNPFIDRPEWVKAIYYAVDRVRLQQISGGTRVMWPATLTPLQVRVEISSDLRQWTRASSSVRSFGGDEQGIEVAPAAGAWFLRLGLR